MKIIYNTIIPFKGFKAINLFGIMFARKGTNINEQTLRHEYIHTMQMREMLYIFFYLWYGIEYICRWIWRKIHKPKQSYYAEKWMRYAYYDISFEQEAYTCQDDIDYKKKRKHFAWLKYLKTRKKFVYN